MKEYNAKRRCPKCGCGKVSSKYQDGCILGLDRPYKVMEALMWRVCSRCDHQWSEKPLNEIGEE